MLKRPTFFKEENVGKTRAAPTASLPIYSGVALTLNKNTGVMKQRSRWDREVSEKDVKRAACLAQGFILQKGHFYEGDMLWIDPLHEFHKERPEVLHVKPPFKDPITVTFCHERLSDDGVDLRDCWMVVERNEIVETDGKRGDMKNCIIPFRLYRLGDSNYYEESLGDTWQLDKDGKNLYLTWRN